ncbi:serine/threonine-protein kinase [Streptomyces sp. NPDC059442]|uniref:serine/threonine-protein kinase n=1 Tax=unclassified Streptomyces TaxID=2593676 RepID=UPI0036BF6E74
MTVIAGRYRLLDVLGEGGMGTVWRARDEALARDVAVKEVRAPAGLPADDRRRLYARLEREAWASARISHRNVVTVYDVATEDDRPWIVMELVRGLTLAEVLDAEGPMPPQRAAHVGAEVLAALRAAHEAGVLHRDVKPGNVLMSNDGRVVLTDFGIATVAGTSPLTMTGELVGSPEYLAPERALGRTPGPASDLWSLGVLLYRAVEGRPPFRGDSALDTLRAVVDEEPAAPLRAGALAPVIEGLLRKDPEERLQAAEAERQLRLVGAGGTPRSGPVRAEPAGAARPAGSPEGGASTPPPTPPPAPAGGPGGESPTLVRRGEDEDRRRRAVVVLAVAIALLLLAVGGLAYVLLRDDEPGGTPPGGGTTTGAPATTTAPTSASSTPSEGTTSTGPTPSPTTSGPTSGSPTPPAQTVQVFVTAVRARYTGPCPPPQDAAPAFTAAVAVGRTPASVEYRWVTESGEGSGSDWRKLEFPEGGPASRQLDHTETADRGAGAHRDRVRLEVRAPARVESDWEAFSVTCEPATPTGGATGAGGAVTPRS